MHRSFPHGRRLAVFVLAALTASSAAATEVDDRFEPYRAVGGASGTFKSVGSDALKGVMTIWSEDYEGLHPGLRISVESTNSSKAAEALIAGDADLAPMSRAMTWEEKNAFERRHGYAPLEIRIGVEAVAFFVNRDNPVSCLSLKQVKSIFAGSPEVETWGDLGLAGKWAGKPLTVLGRNADADIAAYVDEVALAKQGFRGTVREEPLSSTIVRAVAADAGAIGYSSVGYRIGGAKPVAISGEDGNCVVPSERNAYARAYPLAHFLYLYADRDPSAERGRALSDFMNYALSLDGQKTVVYAGFFPPPYVYAKEDMGKLGSR